MSGHSKWHNIQKTKPRAADILANAKIPIFAVSTYNTDYILIKNEFFQKALDVLKENNYVIKVG